MIITSSDPTPKTVEHYDFTFRGGIVFPVTITHADGDSIVFGETVITAIKAPRVSQNDPTISLPGEEIILYREHLLAYQHRTVQVVPVFQEFVPSFDFSKTTIQ